ncbi:MAG: ATP-binding cassette domain-containing protein [Sulfurimonas sp.]|jgi:iron complex transport system ATP-binding protein|nr:ATP-binding cassette domain-containing protein [Sulfurimonadaceae bacterium]
MSSIIDFENVSLRYDEAFALKDISLSIKEGEHTVILGPNGGGKSTLIKLISCELYPSITAKPHKREIFGHGRWEVAKLRENFGIVTNDLHNSFAFLAPHLSAIEVVVSGFFSTIGLFDHQLIDEYHTKKALVALEKVGMQELYGKKVSEMSTGQLRRTLVARALVHPIKALLLDEPTVGLDIKAQFEFLQMVQELAKSGVTILLVTHHVEEIFSEIDRVVMLKDGMILADGNKEQTLTSKNLSTLFDTKLEVFIHNGRYSIR